MLPAAMSVTDQKKIDHARYRLGAIARHIEQHPISDAKREEFESEALAHLANLRHVKALDRAEFDGFVKRIGIRLGSA